jgi:predicted acyl esterase
VVATSDPLTETLVLVGNMSVDLHVSVRDADDADVEVTVSEVHPNGDEVYVQNGWLRLSQRALDEAATELRPVISRDRAEVAPLTPNGDPVEARIEVLPFAHVFRAGSRIRITIDSPGASRPEWRFETIPTRSTVVIHSGPDTPSKVVLPVVPGVQVLTGRPACGVLRGQPCRPAG